MDRVSGAVVLSWSQTQEPGGAQLGERPDSLEILGTQRQVCKALCCTLAQTSFRVCCVPVYSPTGSLSMPSAQLTSRAKGVELDSQALSFSAPCLPRIHITFSMEKQEVTTQNKWGQTPSLLHRTNSMSPYYLLPPSLQAQGYSCPHSQLKTEEILLR